jgi:hypothetical protein
MSTSAVPASETTEPEPAPTADAAPPGPPSGWLRVVGVVFGLTALTAVMLIAFALPGVNSGPHHIPLAVAGPAPAIDQVRGSLEQARPGAFDVVSVADADAARRLILNREVYGAIVITANGPLVLTASAAGPAVAQTIRTVAAGLGSGPSAAPVEDVRPMPADDPNGVGLAAGALPLVLGGWIAAAVLLVAVRGVSRRFAGAFGFAIVGGLALTAILQFWFGSLDGSYLRTSAAVALGIAATAWTILGLRSALGNGGVVLGAATVILLGNPLSGLNSAPELLPAGWGAFGQLLPPGAAGTLLRSTAFFDGAGAGRPTLVLAGWLVAGLTLFAIGELREGRTRGPRPALG